MKINKVIYIFILLITLCFLTGCKKIEETTNTSEFIDLVYSWSSGKLKNACLIDLRELKNDDTLDDYDSGHISGALSYDYNKLDKAKFITWITGLYSKKATILLIDSGNSEYKTIIEYLEEAGYKKVTAYTLGYSTLKQSNDFNQKLVESTGTEDCGC